ncbi:MAG: SH3 domain-containing protein [Caldilineaceae bacterium]|nr:SH3 domain-containing protein [Caldilineaceae bacterium]
MAVILKRIVAVLVSILWLSLIVVLLAGTFVPGFREALPPQVREFTSPDELRELLQNFTDFLPGDLGALIPVVPEATATPSPAAAATAPPTATRVSATPTAAPPTAPPATPSPTPTSDAEPHEQPVVVEVVPVSVTVSVQAELRAAPSEEADVIGLVAIGGTVFVDGRDPSGNWYRLEDGTWIGADALAEAPGERVPVVTAETQQADTEVEAQPTQIETPTVTPTLQLVTVQAFVRLDANLRSGPGTEFERVDGVFAGDEVSVVGQSADGEWYLLEGGAWLFAALVVEAVDVPIVTEEGVPVQQPDGEEGQPDGDEEQPDGEEELPEGDEEQPDGEEELPEGDEEQPEGDVEQPEDDEEQPEGDEEQPASIVNARLGANLRSGPGVQFERIEGVAQGTSLTVIAQNAGGDWLKLDSGLWVFAALVGDVPEDLPVDSGEETGTEAEDGTEDGQEAQTEDGTEDGQEAQTEDGTEDGQEAQTEDETEDEQQAQTEDETENEQEVPVDDEEPAELATVNIDANLRNGPGLEATIVASVLAGTEVTVVGRAEDGQWLELRDGLWIFAALVEFAEKEGDGEQEAGAGNGNAAEDGSGTEETAADDEEEANGGAQG